jgi:hypothetical protein
VTYFCIQNSTYLAVKIGPNPKFSKLIMITSEYQSDIYLPVVLKHEKAIYRRAPPQLSDEMKCNCGLLLKLYTSTQEEPVVEDSSMKRLRKKSIDDARNRRASNQAGNLYMVLLKT